MIPVEVRSFHGSDGVSTSSAVEAMLEIRTIGLNSINGLDDPVQATVFGQDF